MVSRIVQKLLVIVFVLSSMFSVSSLLDLPQPIKTKFLDKAKIKAILINEGITMHRVVFYLAFVVAGRDKMVVAFENLKPRLHILVKIYRCIMHTDTFVTRVHSFVLGKRDTAREQQCLKARLANQTSYRVVAVAIRATTLL